MPSAEADDLAALLHKQTLLSSQSQSYEEGRDKEVATSDTQYNADNEQSTDDPASDGASEPEILCACNQHPYPPSKHDLYDFYEVECRFMVKKTYQQHSGGRPVVLSLFVNLSHQNVAHDSNAMEVISTHPLSALKDFRTTIHVDSMSPTSLADEFCLQPNFIELSQEKNTAQSVFAKPDVVRDFGRLGESIDRSSKKANRKKDDVKPEFGREGFFDQSRNNTKESPDRLSVKKRGQKEKKKSEKDDVKEIPGLTLCEALFCFTVVVGMMLAVFLLFLALLFKKLGHNMDDLGMFQAVGSLEQALRVPASLDIPAGTTPTQALSSTSTADRGGVLDSTDFPEAFAAHGHGVLDAIDRVLGWQGGP